MAELALDLYDLSFIPEGDDEVVVGRLDTGSYAVFPVDGAELLRRLVEGMPLSQASAWYEDTFGEQVNVEEFATTLTELGFVREAGTRPGPAAPAVRLQRLGHAVFSPLAWACYVVIVALWMAAAARHGGLLPHPGQVYFTSSLLIVQAVITFGQLPLLFLHEGFHILAGRRLSLPTKMGVSNRLTYVVFETQLNGLLSVPKRKRYLPFVAGMVCDAVVFSALGLVAELTRLDNGSFSLAGRVCLALAFTVILRMAWQFQLYLRTDLYYVFATALNCYDLHDASVALLRNRMWRALGRGDRIVDAQQWTDHDRKVGAFYGPFIMLGFLVIILITVFGTFPVIRQYFVTAADGLTAGGLGSKFWDAFFSLTFNVVQVILLLVLSRRKRRALAARGPRLLQGKAN